MWVIGRESGRVRWRGRGRDRGDREAWIGGMEREGQWGWKEMRGY